MRFSIVLEDLFFHFFYLQCMEEKKSYFLPGRYTLNNQQRTDLRWQLYRHKQLAPTGPFLRCQRRRNTRRRRCNYWSGHKAFCQSKLLNIIRLIYMKYHVGPAIFRCEIFFFFASVLIYKDWFTTKFQWNIESMF